MCLKPICIKSLNQLAKTSDNSVKAMVNLPKASAAFQSFLIFLPSGKIRSDFRFCYMFYICIIRPHNLAQSSPTYSCIAVSMRNTLSDRGINALKGCGSVPFLF